MHSKQKIRHLQIRANTLMRKKRRFHAQVFIMATLMMVVYSVSIVAVVNELTVKRHNDDEIDLNQMLAQYNIEMNYQLQKSLFKYITNTTASLDTTIVDLENFYKIFSQYALLKGVQATFEPKYDEFQITAKKNNVPPSPLNLATDYSQDLSISINTSVSLQSINSASSFTGILTHYYGINVYISSLVQNTLTFTKIDPNGQVLEFISGITFTTPLATVDQGNGDYILAAGFNGQTIYATLPSGIEFLS